MRAAGRVRDQMQPKIATRDQRYDSSEGHFMGPTVTPKLANLASMSPRVPGAVQQRAAATLGSCCGRNPWDQAGEICQPPPETGPTIRRRQGGEATVSVSVGLPTALKFLWPCRVPGTM